MLFPLPMHKTKARWVNGSCLSFWDFLLPSLLGTCHTAQRRGYLRFDFPPSLGTCHTERRGEREKRRGAKNVFVPLDILVRCLRGEKRRGRRREREGGKTCIENKNRRIGGGRTSQNNGVKVEGGAFFFFLWVAKRQPRITCTKRRKLNQFRKTRPCFCVLYPELGLLDLGFFPVLFSDLLLLPASIFFSPKVLG